MDRYEGPFPGAAEPSASYNGEHMILPVSDQSSNPINQVRPSLFSSGSPSRSRESLSRSVSHTVDSAPTDRTSSPLLSTLAASAAAAGEQALTEQDNEDLRASIHRRRIPKVEKDADDPNSPVPSRVSMDRNESTTLTTLSRLFAVQASPSNGDSRSQSFTAIHAPYPRIESPANTSISDHLFSRGLLSGRHSDITVYAFGCGYKLHRIILDRSPFFATAFSGPWLESRSKEMTLHPEDIDSNITQICFELALKRLYGANTPEEEDPEIMGLFATACWLEMPDLLDSSIESILRQMRPSNLTTMIKLVTTNYYGRAGDKVLASAKAMLCRDGWKMPVQLWDGIPADVVREIVGGDGFFINGEWDRWVLAKRILDRRLRKFAIESGLVHPGTKRVLKAPDTVNLNAVRFDSVYRRESMTTGRATPDYMHRWIMLYTHPEVEPLLVLLDEGIHYVHLDFEHLQYMRKATDVLGLPMMPEKVISNALWMQMELRQKVLNTQESDMELGLSQAAEDGAGQSTASRETQMTAYDTMSSPKGKQKAEPEGPEETEIASNSWDENGKPRKFWIPSTDCNIVMGGNADTVVATTSTAGPQRHTTRLSATIQAEDVQWAADFSAASADTRAFGLARPGSAAGQNAAMELKPVAFSNVPPFRFSAEFPNPRLLKEKKRVYSRTIFYAGSLWNIYIQKVRSSKNAQLGVYLHRAKERETEDAIAEPAGMRQGSVDERIGLLEREMLIRADRLTAQRNRRRRQAERDGIDPTELDGGDSSGSADPDMALVSANTHRPSRTVQRVSTLAGSTAVTDFSDSVTDPAGRGSVHPKLCCDTPSSSSSQDSESDSDDTDHELGHLSKLHHIPALPPYVDARPTIKTYFKIYSPSKGGRMLSVYESAPDRFNFSQSWGWKSSTLMLDDGLSGEDESEHGDGTRKEAKLKFMVVIGNV